MFSLCVLQLHGLDTEKVAATIPPFHKVMYGFYELQ